VLDRLSPVRRNLALAGLFALLVWFFWSVRSVLNPLILGYLLAFVVHPLVLRLERKGWRRRKAEPMKTGETLTGIRWWFRPGARCWRRPARTLV